MTLKTAKTRIEHLEQENEQLRQLVAHLEEKIALLQIKIDKLDYLNYINEKYGNNLGN